MLYPFTHTLLKTITTIYNKYKHHYHRILHFCSSFCSPLSLFSFSPAFLCILTFFQIQTVQITWRERIQFFVAPQQRFLEVKNLKRKKKSKV